jgi:hypothetical protein
MSVYKEGTGGMSVN